MTETPRKDLVHDAFVNISLSRRDLASLGNVDGYLYTTLRNLLWNGLLSRKPYGLATSTRRPASRSVEFIVNVARIGLTTMQQQMSSRFGGSPEAPDSVGSF